MKKITSKSKKGFTLVELIVVLVILAILAAMLVPALTGYIKRAREEKEYQTASTVYSAAQAEVTEYYGRSTGTFAAGTITQSTPTGYGDKVLDLAGVDTSAVTAFSFSYGANGIITGGSVTINGSVYTLTITSGVPSWTAAAST
ncbi:MAG: type II secretion system protein [Clostridiales bacterium]|nr:type II secretion system protein [Clostridiales bacterium]